MARPPVARARALMLVAPLLASGCHRSRHTHSDSFAPHPVPAGFVERSGAGWRLALPATWTDVTRKNSPAWVAADPHAADDYHANVNVVGESFAGESYEYARANLATLRQEPRAGVETQREDVVDGDPTLLIEAHWTPAPPSSVAYRTMQAAVSARGRGHVVTCSVAASAFERYRSTCESIVRSFAVER
ncbi:MAG: hypothetical protein JOZ69_00195 [Myxococcales bacterium]|nr:hypothetical protein [Myxococcales bacterium]